MFGTSVQKWIDIRSALIAKDMSKLFSNEFLKTVRFDSYYIDADLNLVASL
jgi:hypothetical protein